MFNLLGAINRLLLLQAFYRALAIEARTMTFTTINSSTAETIVVEIPLDTAIEPTTVEPSSVFVRFVLNQLNVTRLRAALAVNEIETMTIALSGGLIEPEAVVLWLSDTGLEISSAEYGAHNAND